MSLYSGMRMNIKQIEDSRGRLLSVSGESHSDHMYEIQMIRNNQPQGLLQFQTEEHPDELDCLYYIQGLTSLQEAVDQEDTDYLYSVIFALERMADVLSEYMLSADRLLLDPEAIFLKKETGMVCFCYYPAKAGTFQQAFQAMMEWFMRKLNPVDEEDVLLLYRLYQRSRENDMTIKEPAAIWKEAKLNRAEEEKEDAGNEASFIRADNSFDREPADEKSRLLLDLGIQLPVKETSFSRWKKRNGLPEETEEVPAPDVEIAGAEDMYTMKDRLSVFMQNNKTEAVIFTVLALIIVYLLVN